jgi:3-oxoadipate enol-lactonase
MWRPQIESFSASYQVITCDLPAHGETPDVFGEYTVAKLCEFVIRLLDSVGADRVHICGHSLGGMVAQEVAVAHSDRVQKLVLAETALGTQNTFWERIQTYFARPFLRLTPQTSLVRMSTNLYGSLNPEVGVFIEQDMSKFDHDTSIRVMSAAFEFSGKSQLGEIHAPTLVLVAEKNRRTHAQGREMSERIPAAKFEIIPDSHHMLNLDNPDSFNKTVLAFLAV